MKFAIPLGVATLLALAWHLQQWAGVALVGGAVVMWGLLRITRLLAVLQRTARHPMGWVQSAAMLNARLGKGLPLLQVLALTQAMGQRLSAENAQPEVFAWTDPGGDSVRAEFARGMLVHWTLEHAAPPGPNPAPKPVSNQVPCDAAHSQPVQPE